MVPTDVWPVNGAQSSSACISASHLPPMLPEAVSRLVLGHLLIASGQQAEAARELAAARRIAGNMPLAWFLDLCSISEAWLMREKPGNGAGHAVLPDRLSAQKVVSIDPAIRIPQSLLTRLHRLTTEMPDGDASRASAPRVHIYAIGRFSLLVDGKPVRFARKAPKKPLELLKALIAFGGRSVSAERLAESLWPDSDGDTAQQTLTTTLHRLRKLLGESTIERQDGLLRLVAENVWVDVWVLEQGLNDMASACRDADTDRLAELAARIFALYRGHFLMGERDYSWLLCMRERLHARFLRHIESAARVFAPRHCGQAVACYRKALEIEPLAEGLYRGLMHVHLAHGHRAEALAAYDQCCKNLAAQLAIEPCADTRALADKARGTPADTAANQRSAPKKSDPVARACESR